MRFTRLMTSAAVASALAIPAIAQEIDRPECVAPAQPGGGFDLTCRIAQGGLEPVLKEPVQVRFMPGGIGAVAYNMFNTTRTDDPSAIVAFSTGSILNVVTGKYGAWTIDDARWVATAGADFGAVVVKADSPYGNLEQLMADLKADPSQVVLGAGGSVGSQDWIKAALLLDVVGGDVSKLRYVAFDGGGDAMAALLGGSIEVYTGDVGELASQLDAGTVRVLGVMSPERLPEPYADLPTTFEQGYEVDWTILRGFYMGKDVSDEDYNAWVAAFEQAYGTEHWAQTVQQLGVLPLNLAGEALEASVRERAERLHNLAAEAGLIQG
ncbi:putative tricarboxylic transport membrane protein [Paracoccus halophilus]|uniref:Tricarboxylic transport membrane protein n=1 Tax=Paracoccus halophilus TaxID=376733 RepID=A0A099EYM7_9RHOB|nr:tripartite tricarboxylate transporter substrate-binding protein [Paracoccus halophilus]KGJ03545.1 tricarboxylic transport membrane protein [Paracoccus halophilus]SFA57809.1 putative tricarboxylic transport membrane protein [Paracoccus halophilus]